MQYFKIKLLAILLSLGFATGYAQQDNGLKTTIDMKIDDKGSVLCEFATKYNAAAWDYFMKTTGTNTSILKNMLVRTFPKYVLTDFNYSQDVNERRNSVKFRIEGMMTVNKNGKWQADLERKDPDITKISDREYLLMESGNAMKLHLPEGTEDSKIEKDSFGKAFLTYPADETGKSGRMLMYAGLLVAVAGGGLLFKNMRGAKSGHITNARFETLPKTPTQTIHTSEKNTIAPAPADHTSPGPADHTSPAPRASRSEIIHPRDDIHSNRGDSPE